jgi:hypothetical protein
MDEKDKEPTEDQNLNEIRREVISLLDEIKQIRVQVEDQFKAAEIARKNADSEGLFAINAKKVCEEHSTAISQLKGTVEAEVNSIVTNKQKADELLAGINAGKAAIDTETKSISDRRKEVDQAAQNIVKAAEIGMARLQDVENSKTSAETALTKTTEARDAAVQARANSEAAHQEAKQFSAEAKTQTATIAKNLETATTCSTDIQTLLTDAQNKKTELSEVLAHVVKSDEITVAFEAQLAKLKEELEGLIQKADDLLPHFASTGLASAFGKQKARFEKPKIWWIRTFVACIIVLMVVALPSFLAAVFPSFFTYLTGKTTDPTWNETWHGIVMRLPILIPIVWLAIYAGRNYMLAVRLEEDYAYKEAISIAFEGYKREMQGIPVGDATNPTPLTKLCVNILTAIAERPGRIYDHHNKDITVTNEMLEALNKGKEFSQKQIRT